MHHQVRLDNNNNYNPDDSHTDNYDVALLTPPHTPEENSEDNFLCQTCGHVTHPHALQAVRKLPRELWSCFPTPDEEVTEKKRRGTVEKGRVLTGEVI